MGVWAGVSAYELLALRNDWELMTTSFGRALESPWRGPLTAATWLYFSAHVFGLIPDRWDPLRS